MRLSCLVEARVLFEENILFVVVGRKYVACPNSVKVQIHAFERKLYILTRWGFEFAQVKVAFE